MNRRGTRNPNGRLTAEQVVEIRSRHAAGETQASLAESFGVTQQSVSRIVRRISWSSEPRPPAPSRPRRNLRCRISDEQVAEIRRRYSGGELQVALASEFGISQMHVSRIVRHESRRLATGRSRI